MESIYDFIFGHYSTSTIRAQFVISSCMRENVLRKVRDQKYMCLQKPLPAPYFRGLAAPIPPLKKVSCSILDSHAFAAVTFSYSPM